MKSRHIFPIFLLLCSTLQSIHGGITYAPSVTNEELAKKAALVPTPYVRNPYVDEALWNSLIPYFLPDTSQEKAILDKIFSQSRVLSSIKSLEKAGFKLIVNPRDKIIVARHEKLRGFLIKAYLDTFDIPEWEWWQKRINGINVIQNSIYYHGYQNMLKTPLKWIYPIPAEPSPLPGNTRRNFVLVVQEMDVLKDNKNRYAYKHRMNPTILNALFTVVMENLLIDSVYADNIPFCTDGRIAFIDTEHSQSTMFPVPIWNIGHYLSSDMLAYWEQLITHGVPSN